MVILPEDYNIENSPALTKLKYSYLTQGARILQAGRFEQAV